MDKIFIGLITSAGNAEHLQWYKGITQYVDGVCVTWHDFRDEGYNLLNENKGEGFIVEHPYIGHHAHSMNCFFLNHKLPIGSWVLLRDTLEQCNEEFLSGLRDFVTNLRRNQVQTVAQYSKILLFRKQEHQFFTNTPHWSLHGHKPNYLAIENLPQYNPNWCFSIRNKIRPPEHFIFHFLRYYLAPSSNHMLLGRENNMKEFELHEATRQNFREFCYKDGILDYRDSIEDQCHKLIEHWQEGKISQLMVEFLNFEPVLNDAYCYYVLNHDLAEVNKRREQKNLFKII